MSWEDLDLSDKGLDSGLIGRNEIAVYGGSRYREVVCKNE